MVAKLHKCQLGHGDIKPFNFLKESTATPVQAIDLQALVQLNTRECAAWHDMIVLQDRPDGSQHASSASGLVMLLKLLSCRKQLSILCKLKRTRGHACYLARWIQCTPEPVFALGCSLGRA